MDYVRLAADTRPRFQSSELSRNPNAVFAAAESQPVIITRRDGESLVLLNQKDEDERFQLYELSSRIIKVALGGEGTLTDRMVIEFPWMQPLDSAGRERCTSELIEATRAAISTGSYQTLFYVYIPWFDTALAIADGFADEPVEWLEAPIPVMHP